MDGSVAAKEAEGVLIVKRTTKSGEKRYLCRPFDPVTGTKGKGKTFRLLQDAKDYEAEYRRSRLKPKTTIRCGEFAERWLTEYSQHKRESTIILHRSALKPFLAEFKTRRMDDIDRPEAKALARRYPRAAVSARAMFNSALDDGLILVNPFANLRIEQSRGRKDIDVISQADLDRLLQAAIAVHGPVYGIHFGAMVDFAANVGLRLGELLALRWDNLDLSKEEVHIEKSVSKQGRLTLPKNGKARTVVLPPPARDAVARVVRRVDQPWIFLTKRDSIRYSHGSHFATWNPVRAHAGLPRLAWHELRHFAATRLFEMGAKPHLVGNQLGHTDKGQQVTFTYLHPDEEAARKEIRALWADSGAVTLRAQEDVNGG